jgi:hypothetical protein
MMPHPLSPGYNGFPAFVRKYWLIVALTAVLSCTIDRMLRVDWTDAVIEQAKQAPQTSTSLSFTHPDEAQVVLSKKKLFGPPSGGILRERKGSYKCWAHHDKNNYELNGAALMEIGVPSEWTVGSEQDAYMRSKAWDFAFQWRALNLLPSFGFLRRTLHQEVMEYMNHLDYLTHRSNPQVDPIDLDLRYEQHFVEHNSFEYPCAPWMQYSGEDEPPPAPDETCAAVKSCEECAQIEGCGWCSAPNGEGNCTTTDDAERCSFYDAHQCQPIMLALFGTGCTGGSQAVIEMSSKFGQMGYRQVFFTPDATSFDGCYYNMDYIHFMHDSLVKTMVGRPDGTLWTCLGCNSPNFHKKFADEIGTAKAYSKYLVALGHHQNLFRKNKSPGWKVPVLLHNEFALMFESGVKKWTATIADYWFDRQLPLDELEKLKENLVVHDADSNMNLKCLKANARDPVTGMQISFNIVPLKGMSWETWHSTSQKAKVMIDLDIPGYEFGNLEAALNGAVHIPVAHVVGRNNRDYASIPESHKIFMHEANPCVAIGKRIGEILHDWRGEAEKQAGFMSMPGKFRNQQWMDLFHFLEDEVTVVISGYTRKSYETAHAVGFAGPFLYPHASFQINQAVDRFSYIDFNSAMDFFSNQVGVSPFQRQVWSNPKIAGDLSSLVAPLHNTRLYVAFLPPSYLPLSKTTFGYLATELERRKHRHWIICPETGLVFARQWWYRKMQSTLLGAVENDPEAFGHAQRQGFAEFARLLYAKSFGEEEVEAASLHPGKVRSLGVFLANEEFAFLTK